jgi:hypothetical protein
LCLLGAWALGKSQSCAPGASETASIVGIGLLVVGLVPALAPVGAIEAKRVEDTTELERLACVCWLFGAGYVFLEIAFHRGLM